MNIIQRVGSEFRKENTNGIIATLRKIKVETIPIENSTIFAARIAVWILLSAMIFENVSEANFNGPLEMKSKICVQLTSY